ncbi:hypothetical protein MKW92_051568 [Papaver armeniacum]|nr:hypothetical protein MKW92_051568 [Papaver armeniacum]
MFSVTVSSFVFLLLLPLFAVAQISGNVSLGSSLIAGGGNTSSWPSPSGDFAFGFRSVDDDRFLLAIWYDKISDKTVVWHANGNEPATRGSKVELSMQGRLVLNDPRGKEIWSAATIDGAVRYASMLDNGNFVLASGITAVYSWESFEYPTDTILPSFLEPNGTNNKLFSRKTDSTYATGRFRLQLNDNGNFILYPIAFPSLSPTENYYEAYYNLTWLTGNDTRDVNRFVFNASGNIYFVNRNGSMVNLPWDTMTPATDVYYRATLDFDGVFTQYSHPRTSDPSGRWSIMRSIPDDMCGAFNGRLGSGACGYNSYCILTSDKRPSCECPPGYEFVDLNNRFGGCRPIFRLQTCQEELFELQTLRNVDWLPAEHEELKPYSEQDCRSSCLSDCLCAVAIFIHSIFSPEQDLQPPNSGEKKDRSTLILVGSLLLGSSVFFNFLLLAATFLVFFFMDRKMRHNNKKSSILRSNLRSFTYQELEEATHGFKEELGRGAFGIVYKGFTEEMGSTNLVAVKKLDKVFREGEKEFQSEVGQTHHKNLVRLLGFCEEGQHRLLVYEFMSNGSLAEHLFGISKPDWNQRVKIAFGISRGLMYLHEECSTHCDIKPQNILLDDSLTARIADFGLAKLLMSNQTRTSTGIRGTRGYVSSKVDVYSFGVMLLEIICCRKGVDQELGEEDIKAILTDWVYDCFKKGKLQDLVEDDDEVMNDMGRFERLVVIAIWCIQEEPLVRPSMKKVTQMLEGVLEVSVPPCPYQLNSHVGKPNDMSFEM